jgi:thioredoxin-like negative regulator of GroEL
MLERTIVLALILAGIYLAMKRFGFRKVKNGSLLPLQGINSELPTILYFWTESCAQCKSVQKPEILKLQNCVGFNLVSLNALGEAELAKQLNIRTVPSTAVVSKERMIRFINNGFASGDRLKRQLEELNN